MNTMIKESSYHDTAWFEGTPLYGLTRVLAGLYHYSAPITGHPKLKGANPHGSTVKHRLGSLRSTVNRPPDKCLFCLGDDMINSNQSCKRVNTCKLRISYGNWVNTSDVRTTHCIVHVGTRQGQDPFINVSSIYESNFSFHTFILDALPKEAKHIQIKGYILNEKSQVFLLCTCLNASGRILKMTVGPKSMIYEYFFFLISVVVASLGKLKYVFYQPLDVFSQKTEYATKSLHVQKRKAKSRKEKKLAQEKSHVSVQK